MASDFQRDFLIRIISDSNKAKQDFDYVRKQLISLDETASRVGGKLGDIERLAKIDNLAYEMGILAKTTTGADEAVTRLTEKLHAMSASSSEIQRATSAFAA